jgi:excisionase family DNA binding protein
METIIGQTTSSEQKIAKSSVEGFRKVSRYLKSSRHKKVNIRVQETDELVVIPKKALDLLFFIIENMSEGKSISLIPSESELSTQQAADMLNVSRPYLVKLLENKVIPFKKVGSHRRVLLKDVAVYQNNLAEVRDKQLAFLAKQAQDLNLGY